MEGKPLKGKEFRPKFGVLYPENQLKLASIDFKASVANYTDKNGMVHYEDVLTLFNRSFQAIAR